MTLFLVTFVQTVSAMSKRITNQSYPIYLGDIYDDLNEFILQMHPKVSSIFILVDENTHLHCISPLVMNVPILAEAEILEIDNGEQNKNLEIVNHLWFALAENNVDRQALIINLGGGVVSDLGGFMASVYKRGIRFINIPTTLLAMVDAAVGGKTGVNLGNLKNQIGCFSFPEAVFVNPAFLETLSPIELSSGMGEILKYSLIDHKELWEEFKNLENDNHNQLISLIESSLEIKNKVVKQDPGEQGIRKILNFGHTYGHAFESLSLSTSPNKPVSHGNAVALGIICELWHSVERLAFPRAIFEDVKDFIFQRFYTFSIQEGQIETLIELMKKDKKNSGSKVAVILLEDIGKPRFDLFVSEDEIRDCLHSYIKQ